MSTFTLAISCLTTSNLPWFMDLTFQVPMQYCSWQHRTLLLSPVTSTAGYSFCFGSIPSFFLEFPCFLYDPMAVGNLISGSSAFLKSIFYIWKFLYCWSLAWRILLITLLSCKMSQLYGNLNILRHCPSLGLEWKLTFSGPVATAHFSKFAGILSGTLSQHHLWGF